MKSLRSKLHQNTVSGKKPVGGWLRAGFVRTHFLANSWPGFGKILRNLALFGGFYVVWGSTFWDFWRILRRVGEQFFELLEDLTSCGEALFGTFGGFNVVWGSTFGGFWWILRRVGEHFWGLFEDFMSCGGALFGAFGGFNVVWGSTFWSFWRI